MNTIGSSENQRQQSKQTIASLIVDLADEVLKDANNIADRTMIKLSSAMVAESPKPCLNEKTAEPTPQRQYPELFDVLRSKLRAIQHCLHNINEGLDRTEL